MKKYTYNDFKDKSKDGVMKELKKGLTKIAVYFQSTHGIPLEVFKDILDQKCKSPLDQLALYLNFRSMHPQIFEDDIKQ